MGMGMCGDEDGHGQRRKVMPEKEAGAHGGGSEEGDSVSAVTCVSDSVRTCVCCRIREIESTNLECT